MAIKEAKCWTCGYRWPYGTDGSHNCATILKADATSMQRDTLKRKLEEVEAENERLREALAFYADPSSWRLVPPRLKESGVVADGGRRAQEALAPNVIVWKGVNDFDKTTPEEIAGRRQELRQSLEAAGLTVIGEEEG